MIIYYIDVIIGLLSDFIRHLHISLALLGCSSSISDTNFAATIQNTLTNIYKQGTIKKKS
jgi:hypothetical protein